MRLEEIIEADARYCADVSVTICRKFGTVEIHDQSGEQEDIFLQGDDGDRFIAEFDSLVEKAPDVLFEDAIKHLAKPYVECIWH